MEQEENGTDAEEPDVDTLEGVAFICRSHEKPIASTKIPGSDLVSARFVPLFWIQICVYEVMLVSVYP
jgi:hypothetical protein